MILLRRYYYTTVKKFLKSDCQKHQQVKQIKSQKPIGIYKNDSQTLYDYYLRRATLSQK
jgi:hypothetical protein